jgi:uncharacterized membrane protein
VREFWSSVRHNDGHYAAFLISFIVIAAAWNNHHDLFRYLKATDARLRLFNTVWLLTIVLNPFATKLLTANGSLDTHALRFGFYAVIQVLESLALLAILKHMTSRGQAPDTPRPVLADMSWQGWSLVAGFALSIPFFFVTIYAWLFWIAVPLLVARLRRLRHPGPSRSADS